jgi:hypothetical protein
MGVVAKRRFPNRQNHGLGMVSGLILACCLGVNSEALNTWFVGWFAAQNTSAFILMRNRKKVCRDRGGCGYIKGLITTKMHNQTLSKACPASSAIVAMGNNVFQCLFSTLRA